ncbi:MAG: DUF2807 domain-containing protein [Firmicutes bacterium]|nr:DUF2807 domain-containing protein [Bacillota bacterium]MCM1401541.1 DUF2807 domain-containing protein [Bacteroides sp.]MCM1476587.1 DUF2807 domain-containing protein [Bacteroides sp.]
MKRQFAFIFITFFVLTGINAKVHTYSLKFDEFHELKVVDGINVVYECNPSKAGCIEYEADDRVSSAVIFSPGKGKLSISLASRDSVYRNLPTVRVYSSFLSEVKNEGDSTVKVINPAPCPKFSAKLVGNGTLVVHGINATEVKAEQVAGRGCIVLTGSATLAKLSILGTGCIQADELKAREVSAKVTGTGSVACYPTESLSTGGIGSGTISYRGNPEIKKSFISKVKLVALDVQQH